MVDIRRRIFVFGDSNALEALAIALRISPLMEVTGWHIYKEIFQRNSLLNVDSNTYNLKVFSSLRARSTSLPNLYC